MNWLESDRENERDTAAEGRRLQEASNAEYDGRVRRAVVMIRQHLDAAKAGYEAEVATLNRQLAEVRKSCRHPKTTYYPDPSGNSDSHTTCDLCGEEW